MLYHQQFLGNPLPKLPLAVALGHSGRGGLCARAFPCLEMGGVSKIPSQPGFVPFWSWALLTVSLLTSPNPLKTTSLKKSDLILVFIDPTLYKYSSMFCCRNINVCVHEFAPYGL